MDEIEAQCWICPWCYDDHREDGPCKEADLKEEIQRLRDALYEATEDTKWLYPGLAAGEIRRRNEMGDRDTPEQRWLRIRNWAADQLKKVKRR